MILTISIPNTRINEYSGLIRTMYRSIDTRSKACARISAQSHRYVHHTRSVATRVSIVWWGRLPGLRTFPRSVARAKSIQPEEFRRRGYHPFCAEGERDERNPASEGMERTDGWLWEGKGWGNGEEEAVFFARDEVREACGSASTCQRDANS